MTKRMSAAREQALEVVMDALNSEVMGEPITDVYRPEGLAILVVNELFARGLLR